MNRRRFLSASVLMLAAPSLLAEILQGRRATMHGERSREVWQAALNLKGVRLARPGESIQAVFFIDLNCPACASLWQWFDVPERHPWATYWVPVAYMNKTSTARAAALLRSPDPYVALKLNYGPGFDREQRLGKLPPVEPTLDERTAIHANTAFWNSLFPMTPLTLYRTADGKYWQLLGLLPEPRMSGYFSQLAPKTLETYTGK